MSCFISRTARNWSTVSSYGKLASISACHGESCAYAWPSALSTGRVQPEQLLGEVGDRLADALLGPEPVRAAELAQLGPLAARVPSDPADLLDRDEDPVSRGEADLQEVALVALAGAPAQHLFVAGDAVIDMDDQIARRQALEDVPRDDATHRLGPPDADVAEQLAVRDEDQAVRTAGEAAVEAALHEDDGAGRWRLGDGRGDAGRVARLREELGQARRLIGGDDDAPSRISGGVRGQPALDRRAQLRRPARRQGRLAPAERVPGRESSARDRRVRGSLRLPGQLDRPRGKEPRLPGAPPEERFRPGLRQVAGPDQLLPPLVRLSPQELAGLGEVSRLVEDEQRARIDVIQCGVRSEDRGPDFGRIADGGGPRAARHRLPVAGQATEVVGEALGELRRQRPEAVMEHAGPVGGQQELGGRQ